VQPSGAIACSYWAWPSALTNAPPNAQSALQTSVPAVMEMQSAAVAQDLSYMERSTFTHTGPEAASALSQGQQ
jgi:hypothetical protein